MKWIFCAAFVIITCAACNNDGTGNDMNDDTMTTQPVDNTSVGDTASRTDTSRPPAIVDSTQRQR